MLARFRLKISREYVQPLQERRTLIMKSRPYQSSPTNIFRWWHACELKGFLYFCVNPVLVGGMFSESQATIIDLNCR